MKAIIICDDEELIGKVDSVLASLSYDTIIYRWLLKALDNIEEIRPDIVVVSASIDNWVAPFFDDDIHVVGTQIETKDGILTGRFKTNNCYGPEKVKRVLELGAFSVVVGSAITRPQLITRKFADATKE